MKPEFPHFIPLTLECRSEIEAANAVLPPYSDFNFTSLWCWDVKQETKLSYLFDNLVVVMSDYLSGQPCHSFIGTNHMHETAHALLEHRKQLGLAPILKLVPHECATQLHEDSLNVHEDDLNFDYILDVQKLTTYPGSALKSHRNLVTKFSKTFQAETRVLPLQAPETKATLLAFFKKWVELRQKPLADTENEFLAFQRFFELVPDARLVCLGIYAGDGLVGFTLNELPGKDTAMIHFEKADPVTYPGAYQVVMQETAKYFLSQGYSYINYQQDLGIPGLKNAKRSFDPHLYLKKYQITSRT